MRRQPVHPCTGWKVARDTYSKDYGQQLMVSKTCYTIFTIALLIPLSEFTEAWMTLSSKPKESGRGLGEKTKRIPEQYVTSLLTIIRGHPLRSRPPSSFTLKYHLLEELAALLLSCWPKEEVDRLELGSEGLLPMPLRSCWKPWF